METYTVSARRKKLDTPIEKWITQRYSKVVGKIESVFGFLERVPIYGGRAFRDSELSDSDVQWMYDNNIGLRIPTSGNSWKNYGTLIPFLDKYHRAGNSLIIVDDDFCDWVKVNFPLYKLEASVIKNIHTLEEIDTVLQKYDTVTLPMYCNDLPELLTSITDKSRIRLFANCRCAYKCKTFVCYDAISKFNAKVTEPFDPAPCKNPNKSPEDYGEFDVEKLITMGFNNFKLIPTKQ